MFHKSDSILAKTEKCFQKGESSETDLLFDLINFKTLVSKLKLKKCI